MNTEQLIFSVLRCVICGEELQADTIEACKSEQLKAVYALAKKHDLAHLVMHALEGVKLPDSEILHKLKREKASAIFRYSRQQFEYERICALFEKENIPYIPLKGAVLRDYYPEPWMRTSSDLDILVKPENFSHATALLEEIGYRKENKIIHNVSLWSPSGVHFELHHTLVRKDGVEAFQRILPEVWDNVERKSGTENHYLMTPGWFYLYHYAHMATHVLGGGCGIRTFMDTWILNKQMQCDEAAKEDLLLKGGILAFSKAVEKLAASWFSDAEQDKETANFERYILNGGVFGTQSNVLKVHKAGSNKYKIHRKKLFLPLKELSFWFPILDQKPWLMLPCQMLRWYRIFRIIRNRHKKLKNVNTVSAEAENEVKQLLAYLQMQNH